MTVHVPSRDSHQSSGPSFRIGHGYDLHRLEPRPPAGTGRPLVVGGVTLEHDRGPISHSDGDALYHAVTDAVLGALGEPDIGQLFPDNDPRNEGRNSEAFLAAAAQRLYQHGWRVVNLDATVILERPKLSARKAEMMANIARVLGVDVGRVNVKGKTHEKVDAVGEGRAIEVHCVLLIEQIPAAG